MHTEVIFHLAIPSRDLTESSRFYEKLGGKIKRTHRHHVVINFYNTQLVCHESKDYNKNVPAMYPRHFGIIFNYRMCFDHMWTNVKNNFHQYVLEEPFIRRENLKEEHISFFMRDPSNNRIEFKHYKLDEMII